MPLLSLRVSEAGHHYNRVLLEADAINAQYILKSASLLEITRVYRYVSFISHLLNHLLLSSTQMATADIVVPTLNYSIFPTDAKPYFGSRIDPGEELRTTNISPLPKEIQVENIRGKEDKYNLDNAGFKYINHTSALTEFVDDAEIERVYYPETIEVLKAHTGANRVIIFDHSTFIPIAINLLFMRITSSAIRRHRPGVNVDSPGNRQPVSLLHYNKLNLST